MTQVQRTVAYRVFLPCLLVGTIITGCSGDRAAEPEERPDVIEVARKAREILTSHRRFTRRDVPGAPAIDTAAEIVTGDGVTFFFRTDSVIGSLDSSRAEFLFLLPSADSVGDEGVLRIHRVDGEWRPAGLYIR